MFENADEASSPSGIAGLLFVSGLCSGLRRSRKSVVVTRDHLVIARGMWFHFFLLFVLSVIFYFSVLSILPPFGITNKFWCPLVVCLSHFVKTESCLSIRRVLTMLNTTLPFLVWQYYIAQSPPEIFFNWTPATQSRVRFDEQQMSSKLKSFPDGHVLESKKKKKIGRVQKLEHFFF